jgi:hypothetical protein
MSPCSIGLYDVNIEARAILGRGGELVSPSDVVDRCEPGAPALHSPVIGARTQVLQRDPSAVLSYRACTIVCEVVDPKATKNWLDEVLPYGNLTL